MALSTSPIPVSTTGPDGQERDCERRIGRTIAMRQKSRRPATCRWLTILTVRAGRLSSPVGMERPLMTGDCNDADAFAMFGSDDEDDIAAAEASLSSPLEASRITGLNRQSITNSTFPSQTSHCLGPDQSNTEVAQLKSAHAHTTKYQENLDPENNLQLPWGLPLYLGPMKLVRCLISFGGGRGYVATQPLDPGTLILIEEPIIPWNDLEGGIESGLNMLRNIVSADGAQHILNDIEHFYPTKLAVDDIQAPRDEISTIQVEGMMKKLQDMYKDHGLLKECTELALDRGLTNSDGSALIDRDFLRILLAIRYNSLESGLYLHAAMFNHSDSPNCVKFLPATGKTFSEVRATRHVSAGEPLTISYIPRIVSHHSRRSYLFDQHRFDIGFNLRSELLKMELIAGVLPTSSLEEPNRESTVSRVEHATAELRELYREVENSSDDTEQIKGLEQAALELCLQAQEQLDNKHHLLLIPCHELHLDCCDLVQRKCNLSRTQREGLLWRTVDTARKQVTLEEMLYGADHFKLAGTYLDLAQAIEVLLSQCPKRLLMTKDGLDSLSAWSALAHKARQEYNRIKALYPDNAETFITDQEPI